MKATRTCSVPDCLAVVSARGWCRRHYNRWYRVGTVEPRKPKPMACSIPDCDGGAPIVRGWCGKHYQRFLAHGDPLGTVAIHPGSLPGPQSPSWRSGLIAYASAHKRVRRLRGAASDRECVHCDKQAEQWAYDHKDPEQIWGDTGDGRRMAFYSRDPTHYQPMCRPCHWAFDHQRNLNKGD